MPRKTAAAAAVMVLAANTAFAQQSTSSVTLSGTVDLSTQYMRTTAGGQTTNKKSLESGNFFPSRLVFQAREDLGDGLYAGILLDNRFSADTGVASSTFFAGNSFVYIGSSWGRVSMGRQTPMSIDKLAYNDPGNANLYGIYNAQAIPTTNVRVNNAIKYESPAMAGLTVQTEYGFGQESGSSKAGRYLGVGASYAAAPFSVHSYFEQTNGTNADSALTDKRASLSARYKSDPIDVYVGATRVTGDLQLTPRGTVVWGSAAYSVTPLFIVYAFGTQYRMASGNATLFSGGARYLLSKRTSLYVLGGRRNNTPTTSFGLQYPVTAGTADATQTGLALGISHSF